MDKSNIITKYIHRNINIHSTLSDYMDQWFTANGSE